LLASRLSTEALLIGKIGVHVVYGWTIALSLLAVFTLGANALTLRDGFVFPPLPMLFAVFAMTPLLLFGMAAAGVLVSLRAPTVRIAQARLVAGFMGLFVALAVTALLIPRHWRSVLGLGVFPIALVAVDVVLLLAAYARFQRDRLLS